MRPPLPLLALVLVLAAVTNAFAGGSSAVNEPLLGIAGQPDRFERQTGQESQIRPIFLGWGQGSTWGSPFAQLLAGLRPIPMIHIGTDHGRARAEAITPAQIAAGRGDAYLIALNEAIAAHGGPIYVRVLAEMNNPKNLYAPTRPNGTSKGPSHSPAAFKQAFRRAYLILHGGEVDAKLRRLGLRPVGRELAVNAPSALTVIWNPIAGFDARSPRPAQEFYPGDAFVDMVGNDIFASRRGVASHAANEALYRAHPGKPYALAEWGLAVDDPGFVRRICSFLKTTSRTRLAVFYDARPRSRYDLGSKPASACGVPPLHHADRTSRRADPDGRRGRWRRAALRHVCAARGPGEAGRALGDRVRRRQGAAGQRPAAGGALVHLHEGRRLHGDVHRLRAAAVRRHRRSATSRRLR